MLFGQVWIIIEKPGGCVSVRSRYRVVPCWSFPLVSGHADCCFLWSQVMGKNKPRVKKQQNVFQVANKQDKSKNKNKAKRVRTSLKQVSTLWCFICLSLLSCVPNHLFFLFFTAVPLTKYCRPKYCCTTQHICALSEDVIQHPGIFGMLYFPCYIFFWYTKWYGSIGIGKQGWCINTL